MYINNNIAAVRQNARALVALLAAGVIAASMMMPALLGRASALQITDRKATIDKSAVSSTDVEFKFNYNLPNTTATKAGIIYQFCTTPLGTCTATGWTLTGAVHDSQGGVGVDWPNNATAFTVQASDLGDCTETSESTTEICFDRDEGVATGTAGGPVQHIISGINFDATVQTVYIRIAIYSDDDYASGDLLDSGTVAVAVVDQLTVNGRVQERLNFCVAAVGDGGATDTTLPADVSTCTAITDNTIDIGVIDNSTIVKAPVNNTATNGATDDYGIAMVNTNASDGVTISFFPQAESGGTNELRSFRVDDATCNASGTSLIDQCFIDASGAGETFVVDGVDQERFGLNVPCIDTSQGTTSALGSVPAAYSNTDATTTHDVDCENDDAGVKFAWNDAATAATLASSTEVVDDEIVKLSFGALAHSTTPTGAYTVVTNYIATPQF